MGLSPVAVTSYRKFIKDDKVYSSMGCFTVNERTDDFYFGLLPKLPFSTGDLKNLVKKYLFCHVEMLV